MSSKKEWAIQALKDENFDFVDKEYAEALAYDTLPAYYYDRFSFFKLNSDELPSEGIVAEWHPSYPLMKCRGNVIVGIGLTLNSAVIDGVLVKDDEIAVVNHYRHYDWSFQKGSKGKVWTTAGEIDLINKTLDFVIGRIRGEYKLDDNSSRIEAMFTEELARRRKTY